MPLHLIAPGTRKANKNYIIRGTFGGRRIEQSTGTRNREIAARQLRDLEQKIDHENRHGPQVTFAQAALNYMDDLPENRRGSTHYLAPILTHFGPDTLVEDITPQMIAAAARALYPNVKAATRHRNAVTPIRAVVNHHKRGGRMGGFTDTKRTRWLTPQEAETLIDAADPRTRRLILTLLGTGCRTSEIIDMQVENINAPTAQVWIADPKNGHPRWAQIEPSRALPALLEGLPRQGAAFRTPKGKPYVRSVKNYGGQFAVSFNRARDLAGLDKSVTPHALRHTWATWFYAATGHNLPALMTSGGWLRPDMAMRYTKLAPADLAARLRQHGWGFQFGQNPFETLRKNDKNGGYMGEAAGGK